MPQATPQWQKSSFSGAGGENCVQLAHHEGEILIRESDAPGDVLALADEGLLGLIRHCRTGHQRPDSSRHAPVRRTRTP
jgi:hypothetical protein